MKKGMLTLIILCALSAGLLLGAYQASTTGTNMVQADPQDEMPNDPIYGYGTYNNSYYWGGMGMMGPTYGYGMYNNSYYGQGMGMGMCMGMGTMGSTMGPAYGYGVYNNSYYGQGMGMGMCMDMMGPMMGSMYGYGMNGTSYYAGRPGMGYGSMYNYGYPNYPNTTPNMNMTATNTDSQVVFLANNMVQESNTQNNQVASSTTSPFLIAGIGLSFLALAPVSWKILQRYKN